MECAAISLLETTLDMISFDCSDCFGCQLNPCQKRIDRFLKGLGLAFL